MYIRPQLSRKKTSSREILSREHDADVLTYGETLSNGMDFETDVESVSNLISDISDNDALSSEEKEPILQQLSRILSTLKHEYSAEIQSNLSDIEYSIKDRFNEMESAIEERESETFSLESSTWQTDIVDKDKLVWESNRLLHKYKELLDKSRTDLRQLIQEAEDQRLRIKEHGRKR